MILELQFIRHTVKKNLFLRKGLSELWEIKLRPYDCNIKNVYFDKQLRQLLKYSNTYHRTIKMKPNDINSGSCNDFDLEHNGKFKVGDYVRIS